MRKSGNDAKGCTVMDGFEDQLAEAVRKYKNPYNTSCKAYKNMQMANNSQTQIPTMLSAHAAVRGHYEDLTRVWHLSFSWGMKCPDQNELGSRSPQENKQITLNESLPRSVTIGEGSNKDGPVKLKASDWHTTDAEEHNWGCVPNIRWWLIEQ